MPKIKIVTRKYWNEPKEITFFTSLMMCLFANEKLFYSSFAKKITLYTTYRIYAVSGNWIFCFQV